MQPTAIDRNDRGIVISWSDGQRRTYTTRELRDHCPCATCREKEKEPAAPAPLLQVLADADTIPLTITAMKPVGEYAYGIDFSDGHNSGIYTFDLLQSIGTE